MAPATTRLLLLLTIVPLIGALQVRWDAAHVCGSRIPRVHPRCMPRVQCRGMASIASSLISRGVCAATTGRVTARRSNSTPTTIFFADLFRAEAELANANRLYPELGLELLPVGMGDAYARVQSGSAMLVPSQNELAAAGLDPNEQNTVPLFGCTKLMQPRRSNPDLKAMPLFVSSADARAALDAALNASGFVVPEGMEAQGVGLDILAITLNKACELIVVARRPASSFLGRPTASSGAKITRAPSVFQGRGRGWRRLRRRRARRGDQAKRPCSRSSSTNGRR